MTDGWRGWLQDMLRSWANVLEIRPAKRWSRHQQQQAVAVGAAVLLTSLIWLVFLGWLTNVVNPNPGCKSAECIQSVWQGRWALASFVVGALTLVVVGIGFFQSQQTQKREYRAYIKPEIGHAVAKNGTIKVPIFLKNYGRTPAINVHGRFTFILTTIFSDDPIETLFEWPFTRPLLHPGDAEQVAGQIGMMLQPVDYAKLNQVNVSCLVILRISYIDVFKRSRKLQLQRKFAILGGSDDGKVSNIGLVPVDY